MRARPWFISALTLLSLLLSFPAQSQEWIYTTVSGDNLWNLSAKHLDQVGRFKQIQQLNNIENPRQMQPGTRLRIPLKWIRSNPVPARIHSFKGQVTLHKATGESEQIHDQSPLIQLGDTLQTGPDSNAAIRFADDTIITLYANSLIRFDHLSAHGSTGMVDSRLKLLKGRMDTRVTPAEGPGSRFEIETPSAISAVRGTEYRASVAQDEASSNIEVLHGKVAVNGAGQQRLIKAGFGTQVDSGTAPRKPVRLLPAPVWEAFRQPIRKTNLMLSWQPLQAAQAYRVELSASSGFETLLWQQRGEHNRVALPDLPDGTYFIRARGIDALGLEGLNSVIEIELDARPLPPIQLNPANQQLLRGAQPELKWAVPEDAERFYLEIASDSDFTASLLQEELSKTTFTPQDLPIPGVYYWRLTSISASGEAGPAGPVGEWEVRPMPSQVDASLNSSEEGLLTASWPVERPGQSFQIQIAFDADFSNIHIDSSQKENAFEFEPIKGKVRYLRIRAIEEDGYQGPWGAPQKIIPITDYSPLTIFGTAVMILLL
ncbi:MAG: FecR domain-containing protein [Amphritea sp.]|nr:FecR domain-containing protein [Amphritea sp.]